jgi:hypothetical protein
MTITRIGPIEGECRCGHYIHFTPTPHPPTIYDGWYDFRYEPRDISIDCIRGMFLADHMTIGFLPEKLLPMNYLYIYLVPIFLRFKQLS